MPIRDKNLYYVGGVVRDNILKTPSFDTDFCYEGNAIEFAKEKGLNIIKENPDFGTVRVLINGKEIDIASTREECYPKAGHLPVVKNIGCPLIDDLKRRDFTINAMATNTLSGEIIDYFNGMDDIKEKKLRILHDKSFIDDPSRIIRGLKFSVRFGFELSEDTKSLQDAYLSNINYDMSYHRLKKELIETFNLNKDVCFNKFLEQEIYKLLSKNQTPIIPKNSISAILQKFPVENMWLTYLGLFNLENLELNSNEKEIIDKYNLIKNVLPKNDIEICELFNDIPKESIILYAISVDYEVACRYLENLSGIKIQITGADLIELGIPKGKIYKEIFKYLYDEKILNPNITKSDEINLVKKRFL